MSREQQATLFMTLLASFQLLLSRYSGQDDIAVGTPTAGRSHAALDHLIGLFVNTLVLRTDLVGDPTFRELMRRVRQASLSARRPHFFLVLTTRWRNFDTWPPTATRVRAPRHPARFGGERW